MIFSRANRGELWCDAVRLFLVPLVMVAVATSGCGGGDGPPPTMFLTTLTPFEEATSMLEVRSAMAAKSVVPTKTFCGLFDQAKLPPEQRLGFIEGRTPRVLYFEVPADQVERAKAVEYRGFMERTEAWRDANSDPIECGSTSAEILAACCRLEGG
jgi:hypothetical protein